MLSLCEVLQNELEFFFKSILHKFNNICSFKRGTKWSKGSVE